MIALMLIIQGCAIVILGIALIWHMKTKVDH